jgi:hypothetical protein
MQKVKNLSNFSFRLRVHCNNPSLDTLYLFINRRIIQELIHINFVKSERVMK